MLSNAEKLWRIAAQAKQVRESIDGQTPERAYVNQVLLMEIERDAEALGDDAQIHAVERALLAASGD